MREFVFFYSLPEDQPDPASYLDALYEAGFDDALVGVGTPGRIALYLTRSTDSNHANAAVAAEVMDGIKKAIPGARLMGLVHGDGSGNSPPPPRS